MFHEYNDIMSVFDTAEALCIGRNRVYELLNAGELKGFGIGNTWKIPQKKFRGLCNSKEWFNLIFTKK